MGPRPREVTTVGNVLSFVAHQDDDLLFMNPDIASDVQAAGSGQTWIVYLTAGNIPAGPAGMDYADKRIQGVRAAWARAAKLPNSWAFELITFGDHNLATNTLDRTNGRLRLVFTFISAAAGPDDGDLARMWNDASFVARPIDGRPAYTRASFTALLRAILAQVNPDFVRVQDSFGFQTGDHIDHVYAARFAMSANLVNGKVARRADSYFGYIIQNMPPNWSGYWRDEKQAIWNAYKPYDPQVGPTTWDNIMDKEKIRHLYQPGDSWLPSDL